MPSAAEFRAAAQSIAAHQASVGTLKTALAGLVGDTGITGRGVARRADDDLDEAARLTGVGIDTVDDLVGEMKRRAAVCEQYSNDMDLYRRRLGDYYDDCRAGRPATYPTRPDRPASWVSE